MCNNPPEVPDEGKAEVLDLGARYGKVCNNVTTAKCPLAVAEDPGNNHIKLSFNSDNVLYNEIYYKLQLSTPIAVDKLTVRSAMTCSAQDWSRLTLSDQPCQLLHRAEKAQTVRLPLVQERL